MSHYHWDHIQGLPFFPPLYDPQNCIDFFGLQPADGVTMESALQGQMIKPYFPVDLSVLAAARTLTAVEPGDCWQIGDATVETSRLHHPQGCLGFRIETAHGIVAYATDTEPGDVAGDRAVRHLARRADVLIYDAHFAPAMLDRRRGWGHSSWVEAVTVAKEAGVQCLILFHHAPESSDAALDRLVHLARSQWPETWGAAEGLEVTCRTPTVVVGATNPRIAPRVTARVPVRLRGKRADGSCMEHEAILANVSLKGIFLVVPEVPGLNSEVEIASLNPSDWSKEWSGELTGQVVRIDVDQATGQPAIGIVFPEDNQWPRLRSAAGRLATAGSKGAEVPTDGGPIRRSVI